MTAVYPGDDGDPTPPHGLSTDFIGSRDFGPGHSPAVVCNICGRLPLIEGRTGETTLTVHNITTHGGIAPTDPMDRYEGMYRRSLLLAGLPG